MSVQTRSQLNTYATTNFADNDPSEEISEQDLRDFALNIADSAIIKDEAGDLSSGLEWASSAIRIAAAGVTLAMMANLAQATIIGRASGAGTGVPTALSASQAKTLLAITSSDVSGLGALATLNTVGTSQIDDASVTLAKQANLAQSTIIGRAAAAGTGVPTALSASQVKTLLAIAAGDVSGLGALATLNAVGTAQITDATVTLIKMASLSQGQVIGRAAGNGTGTPQALDSTALSTILGLAAVATSGSASDLGTGTLPIARIADGAVTLAKQADLAQSTIVGRAAAAGTGVPTALTATQVKTLLAIASGDVSGLGALATLNAVGTAQITDANVTLAKMANLAQSTIIGRAAGAGTGVPTALSASQAKTLLAIAFSDVSGTVADAQLSGAYTGFSSISLSSNIIGSAATFQLLQNTADGADTKVIAISGGGALSVNRGAYVMAHGNEHVSAGGNLRLGAGATGVISIEGDVFVVGAGTLSVGGNFTLTGSILIGGSNAGTRNAMLGVSVNQTGSAIRYTTGNVNDDAAITINCGSVFGSIIHVIGNTVGRGVGTAFMRAQSTPALVVMSTATGSCPIGSNPGTNLVGNTGTDGQLNLAPQAGGNLILENRSGAIASYNVWIFQ